MEEHRQDKGRRLNWRQACEILGCGKNRFYRLVRTGKLPAYRLAGGRRDMWVYESDCMRLLQQISPCDPLASGEQLSYYQEKTTTLG